ncbi:hypothetical protein VOLCADRAFT_73984 [Volvox carteri f. nagariensis]|uniref:Eukaryotic translation initiation factor 3 subunit L n=1 Tax=Volvox carteri f. nagariensis TaxID=3068 RepID=D8TR87_VOLCA|nr:uncharacterized protein VOLCADRAFT_73984 [Volvox carteri f. nagariensis]EFJ49954.1 hypothetical protein VOLCADRAFT_73984 [Volvox carteri f. nagariensis]|eukprot:XP_002949019.1 hypothetical protein VOLCADRAFT_73984 [Volvox carteri f. nagariensis]
MAYRSGYEDRHDGFYQIPHLVNQWAYYFYHHIRERNIDEIQSMYEVSFLKLSDRYYKAAPWPEVQHIQEVVDQDHVFCLLYKEMYFRHLYARCQPTLRDRCDSWDNYCDLFGLLLTSNVNMQLPNIWLWDMVDEFLYQFQSFCQYRGKVQSMPPEEIENLKKCEAKKVWNTIEVLNILQALVDKSGIVAEVEGDGGARLCEQNGYYPHSSNVLRMLGYFSLVGLMRVHCLVGDYYTALKAIYPLNLHERRYLFTQRIAGAHITLFYYGGFSYLMQRRYLDAVRCFNAVLLFIYENKSQYRNSPQFDQMLKKNEQMYQLLAICVALCPVAAKSLDENVLMQLRERHSDNMTAMNRSDIDVYDTLFREGCPKFVTSTPPAYDQATTNTNQLAFRAQLNAFLLEVRAQQTLPQLKQYLLLYSSINLARLAALMDCDEGALRQQLLCLKNKQRQLKWDGGKDMTAGTWTVASDLEFHIDVDPETGLEMVLVSDTQQVATYAPFLAHHIARFEQIIADLTVPRVAAAPPTAVRA